MSPSNTQKKKILYVITKSNWGGAQKYVYDIAVNLTAEYEAVVAFGGNGALKTRLEEKNIRTITLPSLGRDINPFADTKTFFELFELFKKEQPEVVHVNSSKIGGIGALAARFAKVPRIIFTAHGWAFNEERSALSKKIIYLLHWLTIILSHETIAVSQAVQRDMKHAPFTRKKITVIQNGVETFALEEKDKARRIILPDTGENSLPPDTYWIGTIAELHTNKGLEYAISAAAKLHATYPFLPFVYTVIGEGEKRKYLEDLIRELKLEHFVFLVGQRENARSLLGALNFFLLPSITEALSLVILEAGMAGLPTVATGVGGIPEVIEDMNSGILVRPRSPDEIAKALEYLLLHPKEANGFGKKLYEKVNSDFSFSGTLKKTEELYRKTS